MRYWKCLLFIVGLMVACVTLSYAMIPGIKGMKLELETELKRVQEAITTRQQGIVKAQGEIRELEMQGSRIVGSYNTLVKLEGAETAEINNKAMDMVAERKLKETEPVSDIATTE